MKKLFIISFLLLVGGYGFGQVDSNATNYEVNNYASGTAQLCIEYFDNGRTKSHGHYVNNLKNGLWTYWFDDEKETIMKIENYFKGMLINEYSEYHPNGNMKVNGNYIHNKSEDKLVVTKKGYWFYYNLKGIKTKSIFHMNGEVYDYGTELK